MSTGALLSLCLPVHDSYNSNIVDNLGAHKLTLLKEQGEKMNPEIDERLQLS